MEYIASLTVLFLLMFLSPFALSIIYGIKSKGSVLSISQEKKRDARYFGKSFARLIDKNIGSVKDDTIMLSHKEEFIDGDKYNEYGESVNKIIICRKRDYISPGGVSVFNKEIYGAHKVEINQPGIILRAAYAKQSLILADNVSVERWVDAEEQLFIGEGCNLGMSATAGVRLYVGGGCHFRRLYAPLIYTGQSGQDNDILQTEKRGINEVIAKTICTKKDFTVLDGVLVKGDVCSHKSVRLCDYSVVTGNIFAEGDIHLGRNTAVLGNIFTQASIYVDDNSMIGKYGNIVSVIAREKIFLGNAVRVCGYICCEGGGLTIGKEGSVWEKVS